MLCNDLLNLAKTQPMRFLTSFLFIILICSCKHSDSEKKTNKEEALDLSAISAKDFRELKIIDSKYINVSELWKPFENDLKDFTEATYSNLKPLILEQDIPTLQSHIIAGKLSYELLVKFYLYRIRAFDRENELSLNSVISLNPKIIQQAIDADNTDFDVAPHPIFGIPVLLKDNINTSEMQTTAGAAILETNTTEDAFIVERLKEKGALILGKANLSEWAYFFCGDCPSGYSAIGGQTLNPYGRRIMDTGGSSSGSGVAVAANFCSVAVGSETSGSILSPSSQNSIVGLKPTIGLLSRRGIVPISSTLDTSGPMTRTIIDNAILLDVLSGFDTEDPKSINIRLGQRSYYHDLDKDDMKGKIFGVFKRLMEDSLYVRAITDLKSKGATMVEIEEEEIELPDFLRLLNLDMKRDLPMYLEHYADSLLHVASVKDVIHYNKKDSIKRMPYGQKLFEGIVADIATNEEFERIKSILKTNGRAFFDVPFKAYNLDGFLSINNYHAGYAAVAEYPAITVPMGYSDTGEPKGLTFIGKPLSEKELLNWGFAYEQASKRRKAPVNYN